MNQDIRILLPQDKESILTLGRARFASGGGADPIELEMAAWNARWRGEALDHYLPQGWSFGIFESDQLHGAILAQPYLFHRGLTQTLWVEDILAPTAEIAHALLETAYRWARDKHFQCVLAEDLKDFHGGLAGWPRARTLKAPLLELPSARYS